MTLQLCNHFYWRPQNTAPCTDSCSLQPPRAATQRNKISRARSRELQLEQPIVLAVVHQRGGSAGGWQLAAGGAQLSGASHHQRPAPASTVSLVLAGQLHTPHHRHAATATAWWPSWWCAPQSHIAMTPGTATRRGCIRGRMTKSSCPRASSTSGSGGCVQRCSAAVLRWWHGGTVASPQTLNLLTPVPTQHAHTHASLGKREPTALYVSFYALIAVHESRLHRFRILMQHLDGYFVQSYFYVIELN